MLPEGVNRSRAPAAARQRNWCFTLNNPGALPHPLADHWLTDHAVSFCIFSEEVGETGTFHLQGYLEFSKKASLPACQALPGLQGAHFESRRGTQAEAIAYCEKILHPDRFTAADLATHVAGPYRWGEPKAQGSRTDITEVQSRLDAGTPMSQIAREFPSVYMRLSRGLVNYRRVTGEPREFESLVFLFLGPSGTQKTTLARLLAKALGSVYFVPSRKGSGLYYDDYDFQDVLFFDEFDGSTMPPTHFNMLCQPHPYTLPAHGSGGSHMRSKYIFITTNYHPKYWWAKRAPDQIYQTMRRIHVWIPRLLPPSVFRARVANPASYLAVQHGKQGHVQFVSSEPDDEFIDELIKL